MTVAAAIELQALSKRYGSTTTTRCPGPGVVLPSGHTPARRGLAP